MEVFGALIFWGFIWVTLTWRCFSVTSICKEVAEGKTTKDALLFQILQGGIFLFAASSILWSGRNITRIIVSGSLFITGIWYFYSCVKTVIELKKIRSTEGGNGSKSPKP